MTISHKEPPSSQEEIPVASAARSATAGARASALHNSALAWLPQISAWWVRHQDMAKLAGPAAAYLALVCVFLFGAWGLLAAAIASALLVKYGPAVSADTMLSLYRAQPIAPRQGAALRTALATLSTRAGLTAAPAIAIVPSKIGRASCRERVCLAV